MDSEALQRVRNWLEGGGSSWGVPMQDMQMMTDTIEAQANEIQWLNTLIEDKAAKQIEADGNRIEALQADKAKLREALGWFLNDSRFVVQVGGNPYAVPQMIGAARAALQETGQ